MHPDSLYTIARPPRFTILDRGVAFSGFTLAITGGTGRYVGARGQVVYSYPIYTNTLYLM